MSFISNFKRARKDPQYTGFMNLARSIGRRKLPPPPPQWIRRRGRLEWVPRSPDLNLLDSAVWGCVQSNVYTMKIRFKDHFLRERISTVCRSITPQLLVTSILRNAGDRFQVLFDLNRSYIQQII